MAARRKHRSIYERALSKVTAVDRRAAAEVAADLEVIRGACEQAAEAYFEGEAHAHIWDELRGKLWAGVARLVPAGFPPDTGPVVEWAARG